VRADGHCKSCGQPIRWAKSFTTGKRIPLNTTPTDTGNLGVVAWDEQPGTFALPLVAINPSTGSAVTPYRYTSHFANCPQADKWRKR
jgi:hypothetical protein